MLAGSLEAYLAKANHTVSAHSDPQAALLSADRRVPDLVIIELQLAAHSGVEFLYEFRSYPDWHSVPIVVFTNLHPDQLAAYQPVLSDLSVTSCLYKTQSGLSEVSDAAERALSIHAQV